MMTVKHIAIGAAALLLAGAWIPAQAADKIESAYDVEVAGISVMSISFEATVDGNNYDASLRAKTRGMASLFKKLEMNATSGGKLEKNAFSPASFYFKRKSGDKTRKVNLVWNPNGVANIDDTFKPEGLKRLTAALNDGSIDPLSAILNVGLGGENQPCSGTFRTYDGRDLYDMIFKPKSQTADSHECEVTAISVAGKDFENALPDKAKNSTYRATFRSYTASGSNTRLHVPVRVTGQLEGQGFKAKIKWLTINGETVIN